MAQKKILAVGFECPGGEIEYLPADSDRSLLDADIIIFQPGIPQGHFSYESYNGKALLTESGSFEAVEQASHWRSELRAALQAGKTVLIFLSRPKDVFVYSGSKSYSGTGRNQRTTRHVTEFSSYDSLPIKFYRLRPKGGEVIVPAKSLEFLATYWNEFARHSEYQVYFDGPFTDILLTTKIGRKVVGGAQRSEGNLVFLPPLTWDENEFLEYDEEDNAIWSAKAIEFGRRFVSALIELDKNVRATTESTPRPDWVDVNDYRLETEEAIENEVRKLSEELESLQQQRSQKLADLDNQRSLKRLLYEQGSQLEEAILEALGLLGFTASNFKEAGSEFDVVFVAPDGQRLIGEAEGRDNKAINIDKLSQLERNLQEDFAREQVTAYAKGVLFGNAFRLTPPNDRPAFFTEKCMSGANRSKVALVRTTDLFGVAKALKDLPDSVYASACRKAIVETAGKIVDFPKPGADAKPTKSSSLDHNLPGSMPDPIQSCRA